MRQRRTPRWTGPAPAVLVALVVALAALLGACAAGAAGTPTTPPAATPQGVAGIMAASDLVVGENRFPFGVATQDGKLIEGAQVRVAFYRLGQDGTAEYRSEADAVFRQVRQSFPHVHADGQVHEHEDAVGVYVVEPVTFETPGYWQARLTVTLADGQEAQKGTMAFEVKERSATFAVGDPVPASRNPTARDVADPRDLTTHEPYVPGLYQLTVEEALAQGRPFVVAFATPAYCVSRMCGPVTQEVTRVYEAYGDRVPFIHIEPFRLDVARTEGRLVLTEVAREWRLPTEPWVFVVGADGRVAHRFEGLVTAEELAQAVEATLS